MLLLLHKRLAIALPAALHPCQVEARAQLYNIDDLVIAAHFLFQHQRTLAVEDGDRAACGGSWQHYMQLVVCRVGIQAQFNVFGDSGCDPGGKASTGDPSPNKPTMDCAKARMLSVRCCNAATLASGPPLPARAYA